MILLSLFPNAAIVCCIFSWCYLECNSVFVMFSALTEVPRAILFSIMFAFDLSPSAGGGVRKARNAEERVSTMGAFVHLLHELGEPEG